MPCLSRLCMIDTEDWVFGLGVFMGGGRGAPGAKGDGGGRTQACQVGRGKQKMIVRGAHYRRMWRSSFPDNSAQKRAVRAALFDHTVRGALSPPHTSRR